jgi:hypothetical protein
MELDTVKDTKLIDLSAALITGILLFVLDLWDWLGFFKEIQFIISRALTWTGIFILVSLMLFLWNHKLRTQGGWILIALLGVTIVAGIHEMMARADDPDEYLFRAYSFFPKEIGKYILPAILFMGIVHYFGLLIQCILPQRNKYD